MSRAAKTLIALVIIAVAISVVSLVRPFQIWAPDGMPLPEGMFFVAGITVMSLGMAFLWGATTAGIAALWASARKRQPNLLAAFNVGFALFVGVQILGQVAYEYYAAKMKPIEAPVPLNQIPASKEIK